MSYVATLHLYRIKFGTKLIRSLHCSLDKGVAYTKGGGVKDKRTNCQKCSFSSYCLEYAFQKCGTICVQCTCYATLVVCGNISQRGFLEGVITSTLRRYMSVSDVGAGE